MGDNDGVDMHLRDVFSTQGNPIEKITEALLITTPKAMGISELHVDKLKTLHTAYRDSVGTVSPMPFPAV